jgi:hypothetical protein
MGGEGDDQPRCGECGLALQVRGCTPGKCRDFVEKRTPALNRPFGKPNILTSSEKAKRSQETEASRATNNLHDYVVGNLVRRREWVDHRERAVEWAEGESRRYTTILVAVRQVQPTWTAEAVRKEALRLLEIESGNRERPISYVPKK